MERKSSEEGHTLTVPGICEVLGITKDQYAETQKARNILHPASLNITIGEDRETELQDLVPDPDVEDEESILSRYEAEAQKKTVWATADAWTTPRQMKVLKLHYIQNMSFTDIGEEMGISPERVRQIITDALDRLRASREVTEKLESLDEEIYSRAAHRARIGYSDTLRTGDTEQLAILKTELEERKMKKVVKDAVPVYVHDSKFLERLTPEQKNLLAWYESFTGKALDLPV